MKTTEWQGRREDPAWLEAFPIHPNSPDKRLPFVELIGPEQAVRENRVKWLRKPQLQTLQGKPSSKFPPGNFDVTAGYIIGFTDLCDSAICVDLRPPEGPSIIYECIAPVDAVYATAFNSIDGFIKFFHANSTPTSR
jgi:hypothetical protein